MNFFKKMINNAIMKEICGNIQWRQRRGKRYKNQIKWNTLQVGMSLLGLVLVLSLLFTLLILCVSGVAMIPITVSLPLPLSHSHSPTFFLSLSLTSLSSLAHSLSHSHFSLSLFTLFFLSFVQIINDYDSLQSRHVVV